MHRRTSFLIACDSLARKIFAKLDRAADLAKQTWGEFLVSSIPERDWRNYTLGSYGNNIDYAAISAEFGLHGWEWSVVRDFFPAPPAKILTSAAGAGRELLALSRLGYSVTGFEPAPALAARAEELAKRHPGLLFEPGGYEEWTAHRLSQIDANGPYDAVILGWGSWSHLSDESMRQAILAKARAVCPHGPILLSWIPIRPLTPRMRAFRGFLRMLGLREAQDEHRHLHWASLGFARQTSVESIQAMAKSTGSKVIHAEERSHYPFHYPHAVLGPAEQKST